MKKYLCVFIIGGVLITGCSSQTDTGTVKEKSIEVKETKIKKDTVVSDYIKSITIKLGNITADVNKLSEYTKRSKESPYMLDDGVFGYSVRDTCSQLYKDIQSIKEVYVGTDERVLSIHNTIIKGVNELEYVSDNYPVALLGGDADGMRLVVAHMTNGISYLNEASLESKSYK